LTVERTRRTNLTAFGEVRPEGIGDGAIALINVAVNELGRNVDLQHLGPLASYGGQCRRSPDDLRTNVMAMQRRTDFDAVAIAFATPSAVRSTLMWRAPQRGLARRAAASLGRLTSKGEHGGWPPQLLPKDCS